MKELDKKQKTSSYDNDDSSFTVSDLTLDHSFSTFSAPSANKDC